MVNIESAPAIPRGSLGPPQEAFIAGPLTMTPFSPLSERGGLSVENVPLSAFIPPPSERGYFPGNYLNTAGHELNHALVAMALNEKVIGISLKQKGNILGQTFFTGLINLGHSQTIAAAGTVSPLVGGSASGFGSDLFQIDMIDVLAKRRAPGAGRGTAISRAESLLGNYNPEVRTRAAELLAFLGTTMDIIPGSLIPVILERAEVEIMMETAGMGQHIKATHSEYHAVELPKQHTIIETGDGSEYRIIHIDGETKTETVVCGFCGGTNGNHAPICELVRNEENSLLPKPDLKLKVPEMFPKNEIIFTG